MAFAAALALTAWLKRSRIAALALDHPNRRSLHAAPVPRIGGFGILAGAGAAWLALRPELPPAVWIALALAIVISAADDVRGVATAVRFSVHLIAGAVAAYALLADFGLIVVAAAALGIAWMANLYNFMDGADGLAGGMALFGFSFYGIAAWSAGDPALALASFAVAAGAAAFLVFNFPPAKVFMGDAGAVPLGFVAAVFGVVGWLHRDWPWWFPAIVFSPFIVDATLTLARRALRGERPWEAHRGHYYQRLVRLGWGHRKTALAEYAAMSACGIAAVAARDASPALQWTVIVAVVLTYALLAVAIDRTWSKFELAGAS
jgi:UDP-N-acetylmuramyl pentapeptide phosphotransferase/UDP-N-acetylglucosamine-1-phosphate transferase